MAEIEIEKKKPIWPWIILVLVILAILYFLVFDDDEEDVIEDVNTEQIDEGVMEDEEMDTWDDETNDTLSWNSDAGAQDISGYLAFVDTSAEMGMEHEYTNNALIHLINATQAAANSVDFNIDAEMESLKSKAQDILENPESETHADTIRQISTEIADILQRMQQEKFPDLQQETEQVVTAANNIQGSVSTLEQKDQINSFFQEAADVLENMS